MTVKAGQKCTAIRRAIVPRAQLDAVAQALRARLAKVVVGDPAVEGVKMGALASHAQLADVNERVALLRHSAELVCGGEGAVPLGAGTEHGAFFAPTLLLCNDPLHNQAVHSIEAFGPVSTLMPYDGIDEAISLAAKGQGSLVASLVTRDPQVAATRHPAAGHAARPPAHPGCARPRPSPPATARRCRCSSTAARAAPAVVKSWAACAPSPTTCSARQCKARRPC
jgi:oxepin-CoA hydrolase/3-oxo-5,6-dehydrosuberyl-CoA semialdehyde dehydrogenase